MLQPPQGFCPALPLHTQSPPGITSTGKLLDTPSCPPPPTSSHSSMQGWSPWDALSAQLPRCSNHPRACLLPQAMGGPNMHGGLVSQHRARPRGETQETLRTGRVAGHVSLWHPCHTTLQDQVQLCPAFPSLPEGRWPGPAALTLASITFDLLAHSFFPQRLYPDERG